MSTLLTINVKNLENANQGFFFFQQPAIYSGGAKVYTNSLFSQNLGPYSQTGSILTFQVNLQFYAGVQQTHSTPEVGHSSGYSSASRPIELTPSGGGSSVNNSTNMTVDPLGLSVPAHTEGVQPGAYRITTPSWQPPAMYNAGSAVEANGGIVLSNFVQAQPLQNIDCEPVLVYYVQTGTYTPGTVMNFTASSVGAAKCDFTGGHSVMDVSLNSDGTWAVDIIQ